MEQLGKYIFDNPCEQNQSLFAMDDIYKCVNLKRTISTRESRTQDHVTWLCLNVFLSMITTKNDTTTWYKPGTGMAHTSFVSTFHCLYWKCTGVVVRTATFITNHVVRHRNMSTWDIHNQISHWAELLSSVFKSNVFTFADFFHIQNRSIY